MFSSGEHRSPVFCQDLTCIVTPVGALGLMRLLVWRYRLSLDKTAHDSWWKIILPPPPSVDCDQLHRLSFTHTSDHKTLVIIDDSSRAVERASNTRFLQRKNGVARDKLIKSATVSRPKRAAACLIFIDLLEQCTEDVSWERWSKRRQTTEWINEPREELIAASFRDGLTFVTAQTSAPHARHGLHTTTGTPHIRLEYEWKISLPLSRVFSVL